MLRRGKNKKNKKDRKDRKPEMQDTKPEMNPDMNPEANPQNEPEASPEATEANPQTEDAVNPAGAEQPLEGEVSDPQPEEAPAEATVDQWREALELAVKQRDDYLDSLRRSQADFQNFKRRNQTARSDGYQEGICEALTAILPAIDNLERALAAAGQDDPMTSGVTMTLKSLMDGLARFGFEEVEALGEEFDPEKHNAVMREVSETPGKVLEVFQKGYRVKDKIIRHPMVKVGVEG